MCQYCGCRDIPLLRDYIAEHERVINCGGEAVRALDRGEYGQARSLLAEMAEELRSHWRGEEEGLFVVMAAADDLYGDYIARWCANTETSMRCWNPSTCRTRMTRRGSVPRWTSCMSTSPRRRTDCSRPRSPPSTVSSGTRRSPAGRRHIQVST